MMKKHKLSAIVIMVLLLTGCQSLKGKQTNERRPDKEKSRMVTIEASVEEIDLQKRLLTLRGASGDLVTLKVDNSVKRLHEIEPECQRKDRQSRNNPERIQKRDRQNGK